MKFEIYKDQAGEHRWRLRASNGRIIAGSCEGYKRRGSAQAIVDKLRTTNLCSVPVVKCSE